MATTIASPASSAIDLHPPFTSPDTLTMANEDAGGLSAVLDDLDDEAMNALSTPPLTGVRICDGRGTSPRVGSIDIDVQPIYPIIEQTSGFVKQAGYRKSSNSTDQLHSFMSHSRSSSAHGGHSESASPASQRIELPQLVSEGALDRLLRVCQSHTEAPYDAELEEDQPVDLTFREEALSASPRSSISSTPRSVRIVSSPLKHERSISSFSSPQPTRSDTIHTHHPIAHHARPHSYAAASGSAALSPLAPVSSSESSDDYDELRSYSSLSGASGSRSRSRSSHSRSHKSPSSRRARSSMFFSNAMNMFFPHTSTDSSSIDLSEEPAAMDKFEPNHYSSSSAAAASAASRNDDNAYGASVHRSKTMSSAVFPLTTTLAPKRGGSIMRKFVDGLRPRVRRARTISTVTVTYSRAGVGA